MDDAERQANYKQHRLRVQKATSLVNSQAPKPRPTTSELRNYTFLEMMATLARNNKERPILRTPLEMHEIKKCFQVGKEKPVKNATQYFSSIPIHVRQRYDHLTFMQDSYLVQKLLRPTIFLDLMNDSCQPLGRLVLQLFTEACPEVVFQFVRTCLSKRHDRFHITRLLLPLWMEAELSFDNKNALSSNNIEHDPMAINHGSSAGILSFPSRYIRGSKLPFITFTLSFTPINVLNGKRIAFGIIRSGQKTLENLQNLEITRSGKPCKNILISACGLYN